MYPLTVRAISLQTRISIIQGEFSLGRRPANVLIIVVAMERVRRVHGSLNDPQILTTNPFYPAGTTNLEQTS